MSKEDRIGALWKSQSTSDRAPFAKGSVKINGHEIRVVIWDNGYKAQDLASSDPTMRERGHKAPDFHIEIDKPRDAGQAPRAQEPVRVPPAARTAKDDFDDDIPF